jgi:hypothetical protein
MSNEPPPYIPARPVVRRYYFHNASGYLPAIRDPDDPGALPDPMIGKRYPDRILSGMPMNRAPGDDPDTVFNGSRVHEIGNGHLGATTEPIRQPGPPAPAGKLPY